MTNRIDRHREMAERRIREHQEMTQAHIEGRTPVCPTPDPGKVAYFMPQSGERIVENEHLLGPDGPLRELRMYWKHIPDFGIKSFEIFPSETGWAQVLHWGGTTIDGQSVSAQEADIQKTDENFNVVRFEIYCDQKQWSALAALATGKDASTFNYFEESSAS